MSYKGKEVAGKGYRKRKQDDDDKTGRRKRRNPGVVQFFDDAAYEVDESEDSDFDDDFLEDEFDTGVKVKSEDGKAPHVPIFPKEEELSEGEMDKIMEERYKPGSSFVTYAEDGFESKRSLERNAFMPSSKDPTIWKVKCMVGRERNSAFCLMQKYVDLHPRGTKLQIISAFALDHVKGFIYVEADKHNDIREACKGLCNIYTSRVAPVPKNEVSHLLSVRSKFNEVSQGTWARVKNGKYKGDLAQVMAVNQSRKNATVKLIPRIDLQALAEKFGGGVTSKKAAIPAPRLISSSELEEFRPLIQCRRDRDTGEVCELLDGMMLKDGYLYKKVSLDSLNCSGVIPSGDELLKFELSKKGESDDVEWLSGLFGEQIRKSVVKNDKRGGKGEGSSSSSIPNTVGGKGEGSSSSSMANTGGSKGEGSSISSMENTFELHDFVLFGRKDFGVITAMEKDDSFKVLKEGPEGQLVVPVDLHQLKKVSFDKKFTALDHRKKIICINDTVKVIRGALQGKQGTVKHIYRGTIFLYDDSELENGGFFCSKSQMCEKIKLSDDACKGKGGDSEFPSFEGFPSSPKSPLSPKKPWQGGENNGNFNQGGKDGMFSVGQPLRIRVGPLKGYICRVLAIRRSDVTVKLDSQQKVLTVQCEHLTEIRGRSSSTSFGEDAESVKPFDLLGTQDGSSDWIGGAGAGAGTSAEGEGWNAGGQSTERSSWPAFPSSSLSLDPDSSSSNPLDSVHTDGSKDVAWEKKVVSNKSASWGTSVANDDKVEHSVAGADSWNKAAVNSSFGSSSSGGWGKAKVTDVDQTGADSWNKAAVNSSFGSSSSGGWGKAKVTDVDQTGSSNNTGDTWGKTNLTNRSDVGDEGQNSNRNPSSSWNDGTAGKVSLDSWNKGKGGETIGTTWGKAVEGIPKKIQDDSWGKAADKFGNSDSSGGSKSVWNNSMAAQNPVKNSDKPEAEASGWKKPAAACGGPTDNWGNQKKDNQAGSEKGGSTWGNAVETQERNTSKGLQEDSWGKAVEKCSSKDDSGGQKAVWKSSAAATVTQTGGWGNAAGSSSQSEAIGSGSSWDKQDGGSSWNKGGFGNKNDTNQQNSWERTNTFDGGRGSGGRWGRGGGRGGGGRDFGTSEETAGSDVQKGGWNIKKDPIPVWDSKSSSWETKKASQDDASGWNKKSADNEKHGGSKGDQDGWNNTKASEGGSSSGWGQSKWKSGASDASGNQNSGWGNKSNWNSQEAFSGSGTSETGGDHGSSWNNNKSSWSSGNAFGGSENQTDSSSSGGRGGNWRGGRGGRGRSDGGGFGGRGRSDGGGFGGRGNTDGGGFRGRGRSDRGGFQGRGGNDRGGYGGRGRGRRDWDSTSDSGDNKPYEWNKGSSDSNAEGWKSSGGGSWNQNGGAGKGQGSSWSSGWNPSKGSEETSGIRDQAADGGWKKGTSGSDGNSTGGGSWGQKSGGGDSWGQKSGGGEGQWRGSSSGSNPPSKEAKESSTTAAGGWSSNSQASGWNTGTAHKSNIGEGKNEVKTSDDFGGAQSSGGWKSSNVSKETGGCNNQGSSWNIGNGSANEGASGWNPSKIADVAQSSIQSEPTQGSGGWNKTSGGSGTGNVSGSWNQVKAADGDQSSGWNQPKETEGTRPTDPWGNAANSQGRGSGFGSSGGW